LHKLVSDNATDNEIKTKIEEQMAIIYRIIGICFGIPPATFEWHYYDKSKQFHTVGPISPLDFYETHVKPVFDVTEKVIYNIHALVLSLSSCYCAGVFNFGSKAK